MRHGTFLWHKVTYNDKVISVFLKQGCYQTIQHSSLICEGVSCGQLCVVCTKAAIRSKSTPANAKNKRKLNVMYEEQLHYTSSPTCCSSKSNCLVDIRSPDQKWLESKWSYHIRHHFHWRSNSTCAGRWRGRAILWPYHMILWPWTNQSVDGYLQDNTMELRYYRIFQLEIPLRCLQSLAMSRIPILCGESSLPSRGGAHAQQPHPYCNTV